MAAQANELATTAFGEILCHVIGRVYVSRAVRGLHALSRTLFRSLLRMLARTLSRKLARTLYRTLARSHTRSLARTLALSLARRSNASKHA
eukprot:3642851-Pleurochrysis_carterae.AAC.1